MYGTTNVKFLVRFTAPLDQVKNFFRYIFNKLVWHPVAAVQYTFTHKQYTEYRERNIHNNQKTKIW
jgi:membrane protein required for beta-lactamase induction